MTELEQFYKHVTDLAHAKGLKLGLVVHDKKGMAIHVCQDLKRDAMISINEEMLKVAVASRQVIKTAIDSIENDQLLEKAMKSED